MSRRMAEDSAEICGFLDVKYLGSKRKNPKVKKRALAPWKVWRRHWCSIKKLGSDLGIKVQLDHEISNTTVSSNERDNSVIIPLDAIVCRAQSRSKQFAFGIFLAKERKPLLYLAGNSETESQRWMRNIRELLKPRKHRFMPGSYNISVIDNTHSRASGLTGLYGDLVASTIGIFIKDAHSGEIIKSFEWKEFNDFHLTTAGRPEDVKCICVIHTTKEFKGGIGELHVFSLEAGKLLQDLVTQGRGPKNRHVDRRPLSLSEGDLRISTQGQAQQNYPSLGSKFGTGCIIENYFKFEESSFKAPDKENIYQPEPASIPNVTVSLDDLPIRSLNRRISNISTASGIYEEISDGADAGKIISSNLCEFIRQLEQPPPLPPRRRCGSESICRSRIQDIRNPTQESVMSSRAVALRTEEEDAITLQKLTESCNYVPMSPRLKDVTLQQLRTQTSLQENDYVIMR